MGRRMMQREITRTTIKLAKMEVQDGKPVAISLPNETMLGNVRIERAQREMDKKYKGESVTVLEVQADTTTYVLPVEKFLEIATIKEDKTDEETE